VVGGLSANRSLSLVPEAAVGALWSLDVYMRTSRRDRATLPAEICWWLLRGAQALAHAAHLVEMFDQLGWADDDPRERYEITVALDSFVPRLRRYKNDLADSLADEITFLRATAAGPPDGG
jgi:hypothetical protein